MCEHQRERGVSQAFSIFPIIPWARWNRAENHGTCSSQVPKDQAAHFPLRAGSDYRKGKSREDFVGIKHPLVLMTGLRA